MFGKELTKLSYCEFFLWLFIKTHAALRVTPGALALYGCIQQQLGFRPEE